MIKNNVFRFFVVLMMCDFWSHLLLDQTFFKNADRRGNCSTDSCDWEPSDFHQV